MKFDDTLKTIVRTNIELGNVPALIGEPAIGKSSFVEDLAIKDMNTRAFTLPCNQLAAKEDLTGARLVPYTTPDGTESYKQVFYPHDVIQQAIDYAESHPTERPVLFLDEINRTNSDVTSGILTLVTLRKMGHADLPKNLRIVVAGNDKGHVTALDDASVSRFMLLHVEPDASTLMSILGDQLNPWVKNVLTKNPELVFQKATPNAILADGPDDDDDGFATQMDLDDGSEEMLQLTAPRTITAANNFLNVCSREDLAVFAQTPVEIQGHENPTLLDELLEGYTGDTQFTRQLAAEIATDLQSNNSGPAGPRFVVPRPSCYDRLKSAGTVSDLENIIVSLTPNDLSGALIYAAHETDDNERLIRALLSAIPTIEKDHVQVLVQMLQNQQFGRSNIDVLLNSSEHCIDPVRGLISVYMN